MEWLGSHGIQFDFAQIRDHERLPGSFFYTSNVSVKTELARAHGGFYDRFRAPACEGSRSIRWRSSSISIRPSCS